MQDAEIARLRAENERLRGALDNILARTHDGSSYRMAQDIYQTAIGALVPTATIADVTGGPWNPAPPAPAMHTCGSCKWWNPRSADKRTGSCEFQVVTPASSPYPIDRTPMHETEGDDCRCFERKEG